MKAAADSSSSHMQVCSQSWFLFAQINQTFDILKAEAHGKKTPNVTGHFQCSDATTSVIDAFRLH